MGCITTCYESASVNTSPAEGFSTPPPSMICSFPHGNSGFFPNGAVFSRASKSCSVVVSVVGHCLITLFQNKYICCLSKMGTGVGWGQGEVAYWQFCIMSSTLCPFPGVSLLKAALLGEGNKV